jgi:hypothetical protein
MKLILENWRKYIKGQEQLEEKILSIWKKHLLTEAKKPPEWAGKDLKYIEKMPEEERPNILDLSKELDSGFCEYNPAINRYAQSSPEALAEMTIFVIATIKQRWPAVVQQFPYLMDFIKERGLLLDPNYKQKYKDKKGIDKIRYDFPSPESETNPKPMGKGAFAGLGMNRNQIDTVWRMRDAIYKNIKPLVDKYNNSSGISREDATFAIYLQFLKLPGLGLPKAAFATQLLIGQLGCIDSINLNLYKGIESKVVTKAGQIAGMPSGPSDKKRDKEKTRIQWTDMGAGYGGSEKIDDEGNPVPDTRKPTAHPTQKAIEPWPGSTGMRPALEFPSRIIKLSRRGVELAKEYVMFLKQIAKSTGADKGVSMYLWNSWVELVAAKMNKEGDIAVIMPGTDNVFHVPNDYHSRKIGVPRKLNTRYLQQYDPIANKQISQQHDPRHLKKIIQTPHYGGKPRKLNESDDFKLRYEGFRKWSKYFYGLLKG